MTSGWYFSKIGHCSPNEKQKWLKKTTATFKSCSAAIIILKSDIHLPKKIALFALLKAL